MKRVLVTGGCGYLGSVLVPMLINKGYYVRVLDVFFYGNFLPFGQKNIDIIRGDIRDEHNLKKYFKNIDSVIHLACLSNDPSSDIDPELTREINYDASLQLIKIAQSEGVKRFIYASSSSVYGLKNENEVTEDLDVEPISLYSELKAKVEDFLFGLNSSEFITTAVRSATICGYSPRMRLDLLVNILTVSALALGKIYVDGGEQIRANIHIKDLANFYMTLLEAEPKLIHKEAFNINDSNSSVLDMANKVRSYINCKIEYSNKVDPRSYRMSDKKARKILKFKNEESVDNAINDIKKSFYEGRIRIDDINCYNIKKLLLLGLPFLKNITR